MKKKTKILMGAAALSLAIAGGVSTLSASSHEGATGVVKERMDSMKAIGGAMGAIKGNMAGSDLTNQVALLEAAKTMMANSGSNLVDLFPAGSDQTPTRALPSIWEKPDEFAAISNDLQQAALALALSATKAMDGDASALGVTPTTETTALSAEAVPAIFKAIAKNCGACHQGYRAPKG